MTNSTQRRSTDIKPIAWTDSCEAPHFQYHPSGKLVAAYSYGASNYPRGGR